MSADKIQTGLRIPADRYDEIKAIADRSGISVNSAILFLVDIGLKAIETGIAEATRTPLHTLQRSSE